MDETPQGQHGTPNAAETAAMTDAMPASATETAEFATVGQIPLEKVTADAVANATPVDAVSADPAAMESATEAASNALDPVSLSDQLTGFLQVGGPVVWILLGFSIIALTIALLKLWQFARLRPESGRDLEQSLALWQAGQTTRAVEVLNLRRPASELASLAMNSLIAEDRDTDLLKDELERVATLRLNQLRGFLRPLDVIATLSPLLGLLGTVLGMIVAFQQMEAAGSQVDPSVLSGGIWQALLTTAVGLAVAIPVVTVHNWLERKTERVAALMNDAVTRVFTARPGKPKVAETSGAARHAA